MAKQQRDLTSGNINTHFIMLAIPLIIGNILQQFYNTIDAFVIGRFASELEFAAVGVASAVMNLFIFAVVGSCMGLAIIFAELYGMKDIEKFRNEHFLSLVSGLLLVAAAAALGYVCIAPLLGIIRTPLEIATFASEYLKIVFIGLPACFVYNFYGDMLRSVGRPNAALVILAVAVTANLGLDFLFVGYFGWGIAGAAWATTIVQYISAVLCFVYLRFAMPELVFHCSDCKMNTALLRKTVHYCFVTGLQQTGLYIGKLLVQGAVNAGGASMITAYTATTRIEGFANAFGDSGAAVTSILVAQNLGAKKPDRVRKSFIVSLIMLSVLGVVSSILMFLTADITVSTMLGHNSGNAFDSARQYMLIISIFYILCFTGSTFAGYFDGSGKVTITLIGTIGQISLRVILSWMFLADMGLGFLAVITGICWIFANLYWLISYKSFKNKTTQPATG